MDFIDPKVMVSQVKDLATDIRNQIRQIRDQIHYTLLEIDCRNIEKVYLLGYGDSYFAGRSAEMAFRSFAGMNSIALYANEFIHYSGISSNQNDNSRTLVIACSASGRTAKLIESADFAIGNSALVLALCGNPRSALSHSANYTIDLQLPDLTRSPGIRTFQVSLLALILVAIELGRVRQTIEASVLASLEHDLLDIADNIEETLAIIREPCRTVAQILAKHNSAIILGSGPNYGTALFCSAKIIEAAGLFTSGQELEEWRHVERFAYPTNMPIFVIGADGKSSGLSWDVAHQAANLGRTVIFVGDREIGEKAKFSRVILPVNNHIREELSPLVLHLFASYVGAFLAEDLNRGLFQSG
jgi:glutamine---fructose-6-phosphate transaminase (isomerizing)